MHCSTHSFIFYFIIMQYYKFITIIINNIYVYIYLYIIDVFLKMLSFEYYKSNIKSKTIVC